MELGSVTLKTIGFFCFPIKHSTHTGSGPSTNFKKSLVLAMFVAMSLKKGMDRRAGEHLGLLKGPSGCGQDSQCLRQPDKARKKGSGTQAREVVSACWSSRVGVSITAANRGPGLLSCARKHALRA